VKVYNNVRSSAQHIPSVEVNVDTVYIRSNVEKIEEEEFEGWEYDEVQYTIREYLEKLTNEEDASMLALIVSMLMSEVDMLKSEIENLKEGK
jgi:hypothetical protein